MRRSRPRSIPRLAAPRAGARSLEYRQRSAHVLSPADRPSTLWITAPGRLIGGPNVAGNGFQKVRHGDGFGYVTLAAALQNSLLVALHGKGRDGDHRDGLEVVIFLEPLGDDEPGNLRELDIHEDQVGVVLTRETQRFHAVARLDDRIAARLEQIVKELH